MVTRFRLSTYRLSLIILFALLTGWPVPASAEYKIPRNHGVETAVVLNQSTKYPVGTILISNSRRTLDLVIARGQIERYTISIGRPGFSWTGTTIVGGKTEWPTWTPPSEMRKRDPSLPDAVPPGPHNPLGARALYLYQNGRDTLYRIHGTNSGGTVGTYETSGCFRLTNADVLKLFAKVPIGTRVIVED